MNRLPERRIISALNTRPSRSSQFVSQSVPLIAAFRIVKTDFLRSLSNCLEQYVESEGGASVDSSKVACMEERLKEEEHRYGEFEVSVFSMPLPPSFLLPPSSCCRLLIVTSVLRGNFPTPGCIARGATPKFVGLAPSPASHNRATYVEVFERAAFPR